MLKDVSGSFHLADDVQRVRCVILAVGLLFATGRAAAAPPTLSHLFPAGGQRGTRVIVTCHGSFSWPIKVWAPGLELAPAKESGKLEVFIPRDLAADRVWIRLYNAEGASAAVPFLVGNLKEINEQEPNDRPKTAQAIADPNVTINGVLNSGDVDCFAVPLKAGQTLVAAVDAYARLGSPIDAILQVVSPEGVVLAENHDDVQLDPRLAFTAAKSGSHVVRIFAFPATPGTEIRFSGGAHSIYRLTLTTGPFITHAVPLSVPQTAPGSVELHGWNVPPNTRVPVLPFGGSKRGEYQECEVLDDLRNSPDAKLGFAFDPRFAGSARVRLTPHAAVAGLAYTDSNNPLTLVPSTSVTGCLRKAGQTDEFRIALKKGQPVVVSVESRSLDFPLDPVVKMTAPDGTTVADVDGTGATRDAAFTHVAAKDGVHRLFVGDRYQQGGDRCWYRLTIRMEEPDFELSSGPDNIVVTPGKPAELSITVQRRTTPAGSIGPINIEVVGLPAGVTAPALTSEPTGVTAANVTLKFVSTGAAFSGPIRIIGKATKPKVLQRVARTTPKLGAAFESVWLTAIEKK